MSSESKRNVPDDPEGEGSFISIRVPAPDAGLYRYGATDPLLRMLVDAPGTSYGIRELARVTDFSPRSVSNAVEMLAANGIVRVDDHGNRTEVRLDPDRAWIPDDPVLRIPQPEFHEPVRAVVERLREELTAVAGIILFGSVARGEADRRSDIDLWVLVEERRGTNQRRAADVVDELEGERFEGREARARRRGRGERYEFEVLVESTESAAAYADRLDEVFADGITLYGTGTLRSFEQEVLTDG
jgi:predicted nucleotidyltransferase